MKLMVSKVANVLRTFAREEDGAALTEYIVLLGFLVAGVIAAVGLFGTALSTAWNSWTAWIGSNVNAP